MTVATPVAVIPARGGSKRIPGKNIRPISGRPLMAWAIDLCRDSGLFSDVIVSTDDADIADVARANGASTPFLRPSELADDHASTVAVLQHAVRWLREHGRAAVDVCCVYPAAVFVEADDLRGALELRRASLAPYAAAVTTYPYPIQRALVRGGDGRLSFVDPSAAHERSQDLSVRWHDAGQFYWGTGDAWAQALPILENAVGHPVAAASVVDIDTEEDWARAQLVHTLRLQSRA